MGLYRDESGRLLELDDAFASARGYVPEEVVNTTGELRGAVAEQREEDASGAGAGLHAFGNRLNSAMTLGGTDVLLGETLTPFERQRVQTEMEAHPYLSTAGELTGALAGGFAAPGSLLARTPAGYLGHAAARELEGGLARGGLSGYGRALNAMGLEGAAQSAGQYIGHAAIEDKEVTAEGLAGSVGTGYGFGGVGGGAALGVVKGTMAARRMYSRVMDGRKGAQAAESNWKLASQEALDADTATRQVAETRLDEIRKAKIVAQRERNAAKAGLREEQMHATQARAVPEEGIGVPDTGIEGPEPLIDVGAQPAGNGGVTSQYKKPEGMDFDPADASAFDEGMPPMRDQVNDLAGGIKPVKDGTKTGAYKATTQRIQYDPSAQAGVRIEAVRSGTPSQRTYEIRTAGAEPRIVKQSELDALAREQMPDGFSAAGLDTRTPFKIEDGIPQYEAIGDNTLYVVRPSDLAERGISGNTLKEGGADSIRKAWGEGKKLAPVDVNVTPDGKLFIEDGNHRLLAAADDNRPVAVRFRKVDADFKPQAGAADVSARLRGGTDLEGQLAGTKAKIDEGAALKDIKAKAPETGSQTYPGREREIQSKIFEMQRQGRTKEGMQAARGEALRDIQYKATEELLGAPAAKMERELQEVLDEYNDARKALGELSDGIPEPLDGGEISRAVDPYGKTARAGTKSASPRARQARQIIDDAHEEALLRAKYGADPAEAGKALSEAEELESLLNQIDDVSDGVPRMVDGTAQEMFGDQLAADIKKIWRYEEASAKLADVIGEAAHPTSLQKAKAFRDAEKDSARKVTERSARAVDDVEHFDAPKDRVKAARGRLNEAQSTFDEMKIQETEARDAFGKAKRKVSEGERAKRSALSADKAAMRGAGKLGAADVGGVMELLDLPGLPKPSDLPIVGPMLGAYLKFRTLKKSMGRFMGKVPATADAQAAARASQTRDRIARAVDRSLGFVEKTGKYASRKMPATAGILANRIFDDGGEDPGPKAPITKQAAARMREIAAYVHTPNAIELDVRRELRGVTDPDLIAAAEKHRRFMMEYIMTVLPKVPDQGLLKVHDWEPSPGQAMSFARTMDAAHEPAAVFEKMAQNDLISLEARDLVNKVYPRLFQEAVQRAVSRAHEAPGKIPYRTRVQMSVFYQQPFEPALEPENFQITQSVYDRKPSSPAYNPAAPGVSAPAPTVAPSVAQPTDLAQQYMPSFDRR